MNHKIKNYKGVDLFYNEQNGKILFEFEGVKRETKYVFEAEEIIDTPRWEDCNLEGYFVDGYLDLFIGMAKATRKNIKNGEIEWKIKGQYDSDYKLNDCNYPKKIFPKNKRNEEIYKKWENQKGVYLSELENLNNISRSLGL